MPPNCLWTTVFNGVDSKSQDLTRQVIVMEDRRGKRASQEQVTGPEYQAMMKAPVVAHEIRDPWKPRPGTQEASGRHTIQPAVQGYAGSVPRGVLHASSSMPSPASPDIARPVPIKCACSWYIYRSPSEAHDKQHTTAISRPREALRRSVKNGVVFCNP